MLRLSIATAAHRAARRSLCCTSPALAPLFAEWRTLQRGEVRDGIPDYRPAALARQAEALARLQRRLAAIDTRGWTTAQKVDRELVRAEMNGLDFDLRC
jgi:hypothetical protein